MSPYAVAKLTGEYYCQAFYRTYGLETVCLRYFNVFGPRQDPNSHYAAVIPIFISRILQGKQPIVYGDGGQSRDFTFVSNVVDANLLAVEVAAAAGQVFNIADGRSITLLQLLDQLRQLLGVDVEPIHDPPRAGEIRDSMADITSANRILGYLPQVTFNDGLAQSIEYYRLLTDPQSSITTA
jgi:nucleoside-diphosphate-sugar epimerase